MKLLYTLLIPGMILPGINNIIASEIDSSRIATVFSQPSSAVRSNAKMDFVLGQALFEKLWVSAPASTRSSDGLGPLYNARSCAQCHIHNGRGKIGNNPDNVHASLIARLDAPSPADWGYGGQLQTRATAGFSAEGRIEVRYKNRSILLADKMKVTLQKSVFVLKDLLYDDIPKSAGLSFRIAPPLIGMGIIESISDEQIENLADPNDQNNDGISGRVSRVYSYSENRKVIGRFGWKAEQPDVRQQNNAALLNDLGLSTPMFARPWGDCSASQSLCRSAPHGDAPDNTGIEVSDLMLDLLETYTANLAVPAQRNRTDKNVMEGEAVFRQIGCTSCHTDSYIIDSKDGSDVVTPWTDLLLHDMGQDLADQQSGKNHNSREWRTPPLWGLGLTKQLESEAGFLHDGRARTILEAILWHGGEAGPSREQVLNLDTEKRKQLLKFLESL